MSFFEQSHVLPFTPSLKGFLFFLEHREKIMSRYYKNVHVCSFLSNITLKLCDIGELDTGYLSKLEMWKSRYIPPHFHKSRLDIRGFRRLCMKIQI